MSNLKFFSFTNDSTPLQNHAVPKDAVRPIVRLDGDSVENTIFYEANWIVKPFEQKGLFKNDSDKLMIFIGSNPDDHENLNAEIELWIENDKLTLTDDVHRLRSQAGAAHGRITVKNVTKPVFHYTCQLSDDLELLRTRKSRRRQPFRPGHTLNTIGSKSYEPGRRFRLPQAPEGFLTRLLWIDGKPSSKTRRILEAVWFHYVKRYGPRGAFRTILTSLSAFIGSDPEHPEDLGGDLSSFTST